MANKVFLIGNLTRKPELSETPNGVSVCKFSIAVSREYSSADGERETDYFNVVVWRGLADNCVKYLDKGRKVCVIGSLQSRSYEDKEGIKRSVVEIVASEVEFLSKAEKPTEDLKLEKVEDSQLPF